VFAPAQWNWLRAQPRLFVSQDNAVCALCSIKHTATPMRRVDRMPLYGRNRHLSPQPSVVDATFDRAFARRDAEATDGWLGDKMKAAAKATKGAAKAAAEMAKGGAEAAGELASDVAEGAVEMAADVADGASEMASSAVETTKQAGSAVVRKTKAAAA
jgi:hypothetical protein